MNIWSTQDRSLHSLMRVWWTLVCGWILIVLLSLGLSLHFEWQQGLAYARIEARSRFHTDLLYRRWASMHGGVYVPPTEKTPPNPYLQKIPDRDVTTTSGKSLTLINPAYMTRQVFALSHDSTGIHSHITSLHPLRPENAADAWETAALKSFEKGVGEVVDQVVLDGAPYLKLMRPMLTESGCLKCHGDQGYKVGDIRGGISVAVPLADYYAGARTHMLQTTLVHLLLGGFGLAGIYLGRRRLYRLWHGKETAEAASREQERRLRDLMDNISLIAICLDEQGRVTYANDHFLNLVHWKRADVLGRNWFDKFIPPGSTAKSLFDTSSRGGPIPAHHDNTIVTKSGEIRMIAWNNTILRDEHGTFCGTASIGEDITERRASEERLREQAALLDVTRDAILLVDLENRIRTWNLGAEQIYGWSAAEAIGKKLYELIYDESCQPPPTVRESLLCSGDWRGELIQRTKTGAKITVRARGFVLRNADGSPRSLLLTAGDITDEKVLESQLLHAQRLESVGALASGVAHDLNNVLAPILMGSEILLSHAKEPKDRDTLNMMRISARRGADIVQQLLMFSRSGEGENSVFDPARLIHELDRLLQETFPKNITINAPTIAGLWHVVGDPTRIHQVLLNLCVNARDAMPQGGELNIVAENTHVDQYTSGMYAGAHPGPHVAIRVSDTGTGIPPPSRKRYSTHSSPPSPQARARALGSQPWSASSRPTADS